PRRRGIQAGDRDADGPLPADRAFRGRRHFREAIVIALLALLVAIPVAAPAKKAAKPIKPVELHRTQTERAGSPTSDLVPGQVLEGDLLGTFQPVGDAVLVGVSVGDRVAFAVVSSHGILKAPPLGKEAVDVDVAHGRIRVTGKAHAMQVYLVPQNGQLRVEK